MSVLSRLGGKLDLLYRALPGGIFDMYGIPADSGAIDANTAIDSASGSEICPIMLLNRNGIRKPSPYCRSARARARCLKNIIPLDHLTCKQRCHVTTTLHREQAVSSSSCHCATRCDQRLKAFFNMQRHSVLDAYKTLQQRFTLDFELKEEQVYLIYNTLNRKHCMGILPTGYGKSLTYILPPLLLDELIPDTPHVSLVISPLRSLMQEQVKTLNGKGIKSAAILQLSEMSEETIQGIKQGHFPIVFVSPEAINSNMWMTVVRERSFRNMVCLVTIDEAHCVITWGTSFREEYSKLSWLIPVMKDTPVLFLTATCTPQMKDEILKQFCIDSVQIAAAVPNRENIFLEYKSFPGMKMEKELAFYIRELKEKTTSARKCIIYTRVNQAGEIYEEIACQLKEKRYSEDGEVIVDVFVAKTSEFAKNKILETFPCTTSPLRCLIASTAFGMGVNVPDVDLIIHWGASASVLEYWQEVGRCGRDGRPCEALLLATPRSLADKKATDEGIRKLHLAVKKEKKCIRTNILKCLYLDCMPEEEIRKVSEKIPCDGTCISHGKCYCESCRCCVNCKQACPCDNLATMNLQLPTGHNSASITTSI